MLADADVTEGDSGITFVASDLLVDLGKDFRVADEQVLVLADLDRVAAPAGQQNLVAGLDRGGDDLAILVGSTGTGGDNASFGERRRGSRGGKEETRRGLGLGLEALHQNAVEKRHDRLDRSDGRLSGHCD